MHSVLPPVYILNVLLSRSIGQLQLVPSSFKFAMVATAREQPTVDNDEIAYNPSSDAWHDRAEFDDADDFESARPIAARGAESQPTDRNFTQEDVEAERSEQTGQIPRCKFD